MNLLLFTCSLLASSVLVNADNATKGHNAHTDKAHHVEADQKAGVNKNSGLVRSQVDVSDEEKAPKKEVAKASDEEKVSHKDSHAQIAASGALVHEHSHDAKHAKAANPAFDLDDDEDDVALDELEAMTISTALTRKNWGPPPAVNCRWTPFSNEGSCSKTCGGGQQKQKRSKSPNAAHGGRACSGAASQSIDCKPEACPTTTTTTTTTTTMTTAAGAFRMAEVPAFLMLFVCSLAFALA